MLLFDHDFVGLANAPSCPALIFLAVVVVPFLPKVFKLLVVLFPLVYLLSLFLDLYSTNGSSASVYSVEFSASYIFKLAFSMMLSSEII